MSTDANKALTIASNRLAGSANCMNCGTGLQGPFCHFCGQPDKNFLRFFPVLMRELLEDFLDFDSRFMRTLKPLLFRPGKLTRDYLDGKRFRYVPPLRLYIFSSIAFFFLAAILAGHSIQINTETTEDGDISSIQINTDDMKELDEALDKLDPEVAEEVRSGIEEVNEGEDEHEHDHLQFNDKPWDRETNPLVVPFLTDRMNEWVNAEIEESPQKGKEIEANPNLITDKIFDLLPATMFILLPIVALLLKFWYLFSKKYYVEHLIFALHNHSFIFVILLIVMLTNTYAGWRDPGEIGGWTTAANVINAALAIWVPVYMLVSLKRVYQQGWLLTVLKFSCIGISYVTLLLLATTVVALTSFVLL